MRIAFVTHLGTFIGTLGIIGLATRSPRIVGIVGLSWGIGVFLHYVFAVWAPSWRDRSVEEEVGTRSPHAVASERQRVESRSRRSMEDLSAGVAREIRNPINAAKSLVQQMGEDPGAEANIEHAERALAELDRVERSISHLLRYARDEEPRFRSLRLQSVAQAAVAEQRARAERLGVELNLDFDSDGPIRGDEEKLGRVLESLISNALDAFEHRDPRSGPQGDPMIEIAGGESRTGNQVWVGVADNGPGIPPSERERIWSPFFTTKSTGGQGLGLALSRKTIEAHGGRIDLVPGRVRGSEFLMSFPKEQDLEQEQEKTRAR
jgi:signal transduction histidine kinase